MSHHAHGPSEHGIQWSDTSDGIRRTGVEHFNRFLRDTRAAVEADAGAAQRQRLHVMMGNEAADADSIVSSLVYAYIRQQQQHKHQETTSTRFVPVLPIPRDELALRCDVNSLLRTLGIDTTSMLFVDEFPWRSDNKNDAPSTTTTTRTPRPRMTLLDHNALNTKRLAPGSDAEALAEIVEILDHHMDLGHHPHVIGSERVVAFADGHAHVASSCTLVAERLLQHGASAAQSDDDSAHRLCATLLLAVIALDSINFNPEAKKVTPRDLEIRDKLAPLALAPADALFTWLQAEKFNVAHWRSFTVANCLQCDYKEFALPGADASDGGAKESTKAYGVSAILIPLEDFITKSPTADEFLASLRAFVEANALAFLVVMTMTFDAQDQRHREILFFDESDGRQWSRTCLQTLLEDDRSLKLASRTLPFDFDERVQAFKQGNTAASRKQVVPMLQQALKRTQSTSGSSSRSSSAL